MYVQAMVEGVNVSVFFMGSTGSGRKHSFGGKGNDPGIVQSFIFSIQNSLETKKYQAPNMTYDIKIKYYEVVEQ